MQKTVPRDDVSSGCECNGTYLTFPLSALVSPSAGNVLECGVCSVVSMRGRVGGGYLAFAVRLASAVCRQCHLWIASVWSAGRGLCTVVSSSVVRVRHPVSLRKCR